MQLQQLQYTESKCINEKDSWYFNYSEIVDQKQTNMKWWQQMENVKTQ